MPTFTFGGVGSGIDTEAIISGLLGASRGPVNRVRQEISAVDSAISSVSEIGSLLSKLKDSLTGLDTVNEVSSFAASVVATTTGAAQPGSFEVQVNSLATAYKAYAANVQVATNTEATGQDGVVTVEVGGESAEITIQATDSIDTIVSKFNASGLRLSASSVFDGTGHHLQLQGLDTGAANDVVLTEAGTDFGFDLDTRTEAADAQFTVDGFAVTSASNKADGVLGGVSLALLDTSSEPFTVTVESDPDALREKLTTLVSSYNGVVNKIHSTTGFGSIKASNAELSSDSSLRSVTGRLSNALTTRIGNGRFQTLASIGIELNNDGTLKLDSSKFDTAMNDDSLAVTRILAGDDDQELGLGDILNSITEDLIGANGAIETKKDSLSSRSRALDDRIEIEESRLNRLEDQLRKQFTQMDQIVSTNQAQLDFLLNNG